MFCFNVEFFPVIDSYTIFLPRDGGRRVARCPTLQHLILQVVQRHVFCATQNARSWIKNNLTLEYENNFIISFDWVELGWFIVRTALDHLIGPSVDFRKL